MDKPLASRASNALTDCQEPHGEHLSTAETSAAYGLWIPCNRINFVHTLEDRRLLDLFIDEPGWQQFGASDPVLCPVLGTPTSSSSVLRRLLWAMGRGGLEGEYRLLTGSQLKDSGVKRPEIEPLEIERPHIKRPESVELRFSVSVATIYEMARKRGVDMRIQRVSHGRRELPEHDLGRLTEGQRRAAATLAIEVMFTAEGLQTWKAQLSSGVADVDVGAALRVLQASLMVVPVLDLHREAVASRRGGQSTKSALERDPDVWLGADYAGILPFFQLNVLLGGLFYPGFKPDIFFEREPTEDERKDRERWGAIGQRVSIDDQGASYAREHSEHSVSIEYVLDALWCRIDRGGHVDTPEQALARAIDRFLTATGDRSLLPLKWRVERARRAILVAMLGVVHRKQHLTQLRERPSFPESFEAANEPQLRGYVTLVGAKLPLIGNVTTYLEPILESRRGKGQPIASIEGLAQEWRLLLGAIVNNVEGLTQAIAAAWQERLLYEQEQTRAEQEALAEIERARVSASTRATTIDSLFGAMVLVFTIAAFSGDGAHSPTFEHDLSFIALGLAAVTCLWIVYRVRLSQRRRRGADQRHHYETNLRLDRHTTAKRVGVLLSLDTGYRQRPGSPLSIQRRGSYRVERISDEEAMHKIHILSLASLSPRGWRALIGRQRRVPLSAIYEILYHTPTLNGELVLREVRLTCYSDEVLTRAELQELSEAVAIDLIDPFLEESDLFSDSVKDGEEPSSALFKLRPESVGLRAAQA
ncbi:MAG TPA: hypothetical protein VK790_00410 [Solirubrobacteraceae bacterium]|jgi:hypothetical protein|nr:hypothetical protein [Solirubrobacteraceae bacterium]